jgi:hypothetical protein
MRRLERIVVVFAAGALLWGFGATWLAGAMGWNPVVAAASAAVPVAVFGWLRRGREILDVAAPSFAVAYAAYVGLAIARIAQLDELQPNFRIDLLDHRWPPILMAGLAFALILTVCVAVPASLLQRRRHVETERNTRFLAFIAEHDAAAHAAPKDAPR